MKKILWLAGNATESIFNLRVAQHLEERQVASVDFITDLGATGRFFEENKRPYRMLGDLYKQAAQHIPENTSDLVDKANEVLESIDINMLVHAAYFLRMLLPPEAALRVISKTVLAYDWLFRHQKYDYLIRYSGSNVNFWPSAIMGEKYGIPTLVLTQTGLMDHGGLNIGGLREQWEWLSVYREWEARQGKILTADEKQQVDAIIKKYDEEHSRAIRSKLTDSIAKPKRKKLSKRIKELFQEAVLKLNPPPTVLEDCESFEKYPDSNRLERLYENKIGVARQKWLKEYKTFPYDELPEKYVYMPLYYPQDVPHVCWNPMNYLMEHIATVAQASMPYGYTLVIKEHPYSSGLPSHDDLRQLQKLGVKVVHPNLHSLALIKGAAAVLSAGETTGWEAIMFNRPLVIHCAKPFYAKYPFAISITDPNEMHHALRKAVRSAPLTAEEQEQRYAFLQSVLASGYPCNVWGYKKLVWTEQDRSDENISQIATMIAKEITLLEHA